MAIKKIIFDDNSEEEFIPTFPEDFEEWKPLRKSWHLHHQRSKWEQNKIFHHLATDLEDYAKDNYDLVDDDEINDIDDLNDAYTGFEYKGRQYPGVASIISDLKFAMENNVWNISRENYLNNGIVPIRKR